MQPLARPLAPHARTRKRPPAVRPGWQARWRNSPSPPLHSEQASPGDFAPDPSALPVACGMMGGLKAPAARVILGVACSALTSTLLGLLRFTVGGAPRGLASGRLPRATQRVPVGPGFGAPWLRTAGRALRGMTVAGQTDRLRPDGKLRNGGSGAVRSAGPFPSPVGSATLLTASFIVYPPGRWGGCNAGSKDSSHQPELPRNIQKHGLSLIVPDPREPGANCAPWPAGMSLPEFGRKEAVNESRTLG
ncbi:uncharacterized protein LOC118998664 [Sturnira hondurensis]|uniref:uncharacterized protein LOC118998664 n=1 Tax=Sturnira hondurensis TaxID=192404 RepID=UPI001879C007|nr:uncharacterized protein LOC118998664 [Sturnira hondurensis]